MTVSWLLLAAALALVGARPERGAGRHGGRDGAARPPAPLTRLQWYAGIAVAVAAVIGFGVVRGVVAAAVLVPPTVIAVARLHRRRPATRAGPALALALDLIALALRAGQPLSAALSLGAPAAGGSCAEHLVRVGGLLRLGADPPQAWRPVAADPVLAPVAAAAVRSAASGIRVAEAFEQLAVDVRAQARAAAEARAHRVGVFVAAPLGLCFLPSFVCLGIIPTVAGIARGVLGGM